MNYLLDDEDELNEDSFLPDLEESDNPEEEQSEEEREVEEKKKLSTIYEGKLTADEIWLINAYDDITKTDDISDAATVIIMANPQHTSSNTVSKIVKDLFHKQGHSRMQNTRYLPTSLLRGEDVDSEIEEDDDGSFNQTFALEAKEQINRFIDYLNTRDLSKDSVVSRRRKQRQIPAFIIFLFSSGMYDLILNCPTMPEVYKEQIENALKQIMKSKYDIVEALAKRYDQLGRHKVAERVRLLQLGWFYKEPAEIKYAAEYKDLALTSADVTVYREYRSKFTNTSTAITQEVISDLIEVAVDPEKGIYEKLRDKTRTEALNDVKKVYQDFVNSRESQNSELARKIIFKDIMN